MFSNYLDYNVVLESFEFNLYLELSAFASALLCLFWMTEFIIIAAIFSLSFSNLSTRNQICVLVLEVLASPMLNVQLVGIRSGIMTDFQAIVAMMV